MTFRIDFSDRIQTIEDDAKAGAAAAGAIDVGLASGISEKLEQLRGIYLI